MPAQPRPLLARKISGPPTGYSFNLGHVHSPGGAAGQVAAAAAAPDIFGQAQNEARMGQGLREAANGQTPDLLGVGADLNGLLDSGAQQSDLIELLDDPSCDIDIMGDTAELSSHTSAHGEHQLSLGSVVSCMG